jgi:hypothetical protein
MFRLKNVMFANFGLEGVLKVRLIVSEFLKLANYSSLKWREGPTRIIPIAKKGLNDIPKVLYGQFDFSKCWKVLKLVNAIPNEWVKRSIELANSKNYLDRLHEVYPVTVGVKRTVPDEIKRQIQQAYNRKNGLELLKTLLTLDKFPIKDPYVAFLRKKKIFLELNPMTVNRIANALLSMSYDEIIEGCEEPKEFNRQIGTLFRNWLPKLGYQMSPKETFIRCVGIVIFNGSDSEKMEFANNVLGCNLDKAPDLVAKVGEKYIVGEAKFLTDFGGHQLAQFQDALRLIKGKEGKAIRIAILDGVVWIKGKHKMYRTVSQLKEVALSALLLKDFLESLR